MALPETALQGPFLMAPHVWVWPIGVIHESRCMS
jgi:hypothetical protein